MNIFSIIFYYFYTIFAVQFYYEDMINSEITKTLRKVGKDLPVGAISRIAAKTGFSQSYVSKFFNGEFALSAKNSCILDEAEVELKAEAQKLEDMQARFNISISKGKE